MVGIGLNNIIAVAMTDAVLVADISHAQDVQKALDALKAKNATQASAFLKDHRPWGWFERLVIGDCFQVKRIHVKPKAALSLQSHLQRAEHWIIIKGTAEVSVAETVQQLHENHSIFIPVGSKQDAILVRMILCVTKISILEGKKPAAIARLKRMSADILP